MFTSGGARGKRVTIRLSRCLLIFIYAMGLDLSSNSPNHGEIPGHLEDAPMAEEGWGNSRGLLLGVRGKLEWRYPRIVRGELVIPRAWLCQQPGAKAVCPVQALRVGTRDGMPVTARGRHTHPHTPAS